MYVCPTCSREYENEDKFVKHFASCWHKCNPNHKPKEAPRDAAAVKRSISPELQEFFERKDAQWK